MKESQTYIFLLCPLFFFFSILSVACSGAEINHLFMILVQVHIWDAANDLIKQSLQVAGEVNSLDAWTECLAVGSEVVQIFQLSSVKTKMPKRTVYTKRARGKVMTVCEIE